jgi:BirA family biotin operon repressor/biotin-[acetyl-CoA-carboxylase] ligase
MRGRLAEPARRRCYPTLEAGVSIGQKGPMAEHPRTRAISDRLTAPAIAAHLTTNWLGQTLQCFDEVDSTNTLARSLAVVGAPHGTAVIAEAQTKGRGRLGRSWASPRGKNLYLSVVLRTELPVEGLGQITLAAGVATCETVAAWKPAQIKWPNDVLVDGRKIAGILAELEGGGPARIVVLGIGVNLNTEWADFPADLRDKAISLLLATGVPVDRARFTARLLGALEQRYDQLCGDGFAPIAAAWRELAPLIGRAIRVQEPDGIVEGTVIDLADDGALRLRLADGREHRIVAGDVTVIDGY